MGLQPWKEKLSDIVVIAKQIQPSDRKAAVVIWFAAFKQIQNTWNHTPPAQILSDSSKESETPIKCETIPTTKKKRSSSQIRVLSIRTKRLKKGGENTENENVIQKESKTVSGSPECSSVQVAKEDCGDVKTAKQEIEDEEAEEQDCFGSHEVTSAKEEAEDIGEHKFNDCSQEVQSVHLMISADPELMNSASKFKLADKNDTSEKTVYVCKVCDKQFVTALALQKHKLVHAEKECQICNVKLSSNSELKEHMKSCHDDRPFKCPECPSRYKNYYTLWRHQTTHVGLKPWSCNICGKNYTEKSSLKVHYRTHTGEKPFVCNICHKRFSQSGVLQMHKLIHTNTYAHLCEICGRSFRQRSQLVTHRQRHQGVRPYACTECDSKFITKGEYDRHLKTHTGDRPHHCDVCGSSFTRLQSLQEHKNRHYNFKPYICKICGKNFYELSSCSRHVKSAHTREGDKTRVSRNILRYSSSSALQGEDVKARSQVSRISIESDYSRILEDQNNLLQDEQVEGIQEVITDGDEIRCGILVVNSEKDAEIFAKTAAEVALRNKSSKQNSELVCKDCGSVFAAYKGLRSHARYCKHRKKDEETEPNPNISTTIIARLPGVPVTQWLAEHAATYSTNTENAIEIINSTKSSIEASSKECESIEFIQEAEESDISHAVSIDEDGSITSLPLSQLAPIHIQLENDYMVVLSDASKIEEGDTATFSSQDIKQVEIEQSHTIVEEDNGEQRITLVLNP